MNKPLLHRGGVIAALAVGITALAVLLALAMTTAPETRILSESASPRTQPPSGTQERDSTRDRSEPPTRVRALPAPRSRPPTTAGLVAGGRVGPKPAAPEPELTPGRGKAVARAYDHLRLCGYPRTGLLEQLVAEGISPADASWAVDNIEVSWKEQAVRSAEFYLDFPGFSHPEMVEQLMHAGYTRAQAEHAAKTI